MKVLLNHLTAEQSVLLHANLQVSRELYNALLALVQAGEYQPTMKSLSVLRNKKEGKEKLRAALLQLAEERQPDLQQEVARLLGLIEKLEKFTSAADDGSLATLKSVAEFCAINNIERFFVQRKQADADPADEQQELSVAQARAAAKKDMDTFNECGCELCIQEHSRVKHKKESSKPFSKR